MRKNNMNKKGQITIFVIIALLIVISIGLIIYANPGKISQTISIQKDPQGFIQQCARDAAAPAVEEIIPNGGILNPAAGKYLAWQQLKPIWMCYTPGEEQICTNYHPMLRVEIEKEIYNQIKPKIESCFAQIKTEYEKYDYKENDLNLSIEIAPGKLNIKIDKKLSYTKNSATTNLEIFNTQIASPLYDFVIISNDIVNQEVSCDCSRSNCNADIMSINRNMRDYETKRDVNSYNDKIYSIKEVASGYTFNFAVRNCVRLPY